MKTLRYSDYILLLTLTFSLGKIHSQCMNFSTYVWENIGVAESQLWMAEAPNLEQCLKMCVRRSACNSMNYNLRTTLCELNDGTVNSARNKSDQSLVYAEFNWLPAEIDPSCFPRPCGMDEVCIPKLSESSCSFYCMPAGRTVCPFPKAGTSSGRYVGDVNELHCGKGYIGNDSATCLPNGEWSKKIRTKCDPILGYRCYDDETCSLIHGICSKKKCKCEPYKTYDPDINECVLDCGEPLLVQNAITTGNSSVMSYECTEGFFPTTVSVNTIVCTESGWEPTNKFECYRCDPPPEVGGAILSGKEDEVVRHYVCKTDLIPRPGTTNGTIMCIDGTWKPEGFACYGIRLFPLNQEKGAPMFNHIGYLEMFINGQWSYIDEQKWTWEATKVACREINSSLIYGGTFHPNWFNKELLSDQNTGKFSDLACTESDLSLLDCDHTFDDRDSSKNKPMVITCFDFNITDGNHVYLQPVEDESYSVLTINLTNINGVVCHETDWKDNDEGLVACKSINPGWQQIGNEKKTRSENNVLVSHVKCSGEEPNLLYCQNEGWGWADGCPVDDILAITCGP